jgi:hypothetical protein
MSRRRPRTVIDIRPRFGRIPTAQKYSGIGRTRLYELAAEHADLFRKNGNAVIVDFDALDRILDALPVASIKPPRTREDRARSPKITER